MDNIYSSDLYDAHDLLFTIQPDSGQKNVGENFDNTLGVFVDVECENSCDFICEHSASLKCNGATEKNNSNSSPSQFPYIEKCIPKWKEVFPWVSWSPSENVIFCMHCRELLKKSYPNMADKGNIISITSSEKVFLVSKILRAHHDSTAHSASVYLFSHSNLLAFISLFNNHYKDLKQENEVMQTVRSMFNYSKLDKEGFVATVKGVGQHIERSLLTSLNSSQYFSVVADQCRGIIIIRWISKQGKIVEHVFWSYLSVWNKTPIQYLESLGVDFKRLTIYIANSLCQQCQRCQNHSISLAGVPPRPPSTVSFANLLWNLDFLRPLMSLVNTIYKLWKGYPYKFAKYFESADLKALFSYHSKPTALIKIIENFGNIKSIASEIYSSRSHVEALGLAMVNIQNDERHKKILYLLQEIMDTVKEAYCSTKITDQQIVKLNQAFSSLKTWSYGANFIFADNESSSTDLNKAKSDKVYEFLQFVEKFIDENQKTLYYNGRDKVASFSLLCCTNALTNSSMDSVNDSKLLSAFNTVYSIYNMSLPPSGDYSKMTTYESVKAFHIFALKSKFKVNTCVDILDVFHSNKSVMSQFTEAYKMFLYIATMPFQSCQIARSLFVSFVIEQRLESSVWARMEQDIKPWLLYLQHELSFTPESELLLWWLEILGETKQE